MVCSNTAVSQFFRAGPYALYLCPRLAANGIGVTTMSPRRNARSLRGARQSRRDGATQRERPVYGESSYGWRGPRSGGARGSTFRRVIARLNVQPSPGRVSRLSHLPRCTRWHHPYRVRVSARPGCGPRPGSLPQPHPRQTADQPQHPKTSQPPPLKLLALCSGGIGATPMPLAATRRGWLMRDLRVYAVYVPAAGPGCSGRLAGNPGLRGNTARQG
jgi:hypothetical protein